MARTRGAKNKPDFIADIDRKDIKKIARVVIAGALKGDPQLLKIACEYIYGKPTQSVEGSLNGNFNITWDKK